MTFFIKLFLSISLFLNFISTVYSAVVQSEHYKLSVGQGECNTTISNISKGSDKISIAVTADIGSSSSRADPKYTERYNYSKFVPFFVQEDEKPPITEDDVSEGKRIRDADKRLIRSSSLSSESDSQTSLTGESSFENSFDFLWEKLKNLRVFTFR